MVRFTGMKSLGAGYRAVVIGASGGIGNAFIERLQSDGACADITALSRSSDGVDVTDEASVEAVAAGLEGGIDLLLIATGALTIDGVGPEKSIRAIDPAAMARQFAVNAIGPALLIKHFAPLVRRDRRAIIAAISARVGSIGDNRLGGWISYRAAKAALNQILRTASIEIARSNPQAVVAALHPGTVATALSEPFARGHERLEPDESAARLLSLLDALPATDSGSFHAHDGGRVPW